MPRRSSSLLAASVLVGCSGPGATTPPRQPDFEISNGVEWMSGIAEDDIVALAGTCELNGDTGSIGCNGVNQRLAGVGVSGGIGYEVRSPVATTCAGSDALAPSVAVFSFGSLVVPADSRLFIRGRNGTVALVAARSIDLQGAVHVNAGEVGGYGGEEWLMVPPPFGGAPGETVSNDGRGAGGAGAATAGGAGGNDGGAGGPALPPQLEPLCGGSAGGLVATIYPDGSAAFYGDPGPGGGALLLAAGEAITLTGDWSCSLSADGSPGAGGGAGGTILLEAPAVTVAGDCAVTAVGGYGLPTSSALGGEAGDGLVAPENGGDGEVGGGGGGSAGFIRIRTGACAAEYPGVLPPPSCEPLY